MNLLSRKLYTQGLEKNDVLGIPKSKPCALVDDSRPIALTIVVAKAQESFAVRWIYDDKVGNISDSQYCSLPLCV